MIKIVFFGTSNYCLPITNSLSENFDLKAVVTKSVSPVFDFAQKNKIKVFTPQNAEELLKLKSDLNNLNPDLFIVADYGQIIPKSIFELPKFKTINIHFSRLPKYRGPSPVQYSILEGDEKSWVSIIIMDETVDTGDIIWQKEYMENPQKETTQSLYIKLFESVAKNLPTVINGYIDGKLTLKKQSKSGVSFTKKINKDDGFIEFNVFKKSLNNPEQAQETERKSRAFYPWPGLWTLLPNKKRLKILKAYLQPETRNLTPELVQLEGKKPVNWKQFLEGHAHIANQLSFDPTSSKAEKSSLK